MVDVFEIRGKVDLDLEPFTSKIVTANEQLAELGKGVNLNFLEKNDFLGKIDLLKDKLGQVGIEAEKISTAFTKMEGLENLLEKLTLVKERIETVKTEVASVDTEMKKVGESATVVKEHMTGWATEIAKLTEGIVSLMSKEEFSNYVLEQQESEIGQINARWRETQQLVKSNTTFMKEMSQSANTISTYFIRENELLESNLSLLKREEQLVNSLTNRARQNATTISNISKELGRVANFSKEIGTYFANEDTVLRMSLRTLQEKEMVEKEIADLNKMQNQFLEQNLAIQEGRATSIYGILTGEEESLAVLEEAIALEKERLAIEKQQSAEIGRQNAERMSGMGGNKLDKLGYLPSRISSMAITMLGYQEIMDVWQKTTSNINAKTQFNSYADLLKTDNRYLKQTQQSTADVTKGINELNKALTDTYKGGKNLQQMYSKVDMRQVGANALDTAFKYHVQAEDLDELTEVMAIYSSEFVRQGRSQEDSILAVNDALDGEFRRLKEVNIGKKELEEHGYEQGDTLSLIRAMREIAEERGYDVTAQKITTLSEAINQAELELAFLLSDLFEMAEPSLIYALGKLVELFRWLGEGVKQVKNYLKDLPQPTKDFLKAFGGNAMLGLVGLWIGRKIYGAVSNMSLFGGAWSKLMEKLGRTKGMDKATESMGKMGQTTGGTVQNTSAKDGLKNWGKNLAKNLGKMAEIFIEVAVALAMAWVLMKEAIILIEDIGKDFEAHKEGFKQGWAFLKEYGVWILGVSAVLVYVLDAMSKTPVSEGAYTNMAKSGLKIAEGLAIAMGLIAEAIVLLIVPMKAIESLGWLYGMLNQADIQKGCDVIGMYADALHYIEQDDAIAWFIIGLVALSGILGFTADTVGVAFAVGIASTLLLVAEAIFMLIAPLKAVEMLGDMASGLNQDNINKGTKAIGLVGDVLKALEPAIRKLLEVDLEVFGIGLVEWGNQIISGKDGLKSLTEDILPSLITFVNDVDSLEMPTDVDISDEITAITQMATQLVPMFNAMQNLNNAMGIGGVVGKASTGIGGVIDSYMGTGLKPQLDQMYNDIKNVLDFATKIGKLNDSGSVNTTAISQTANVISQLKTKLNEISTAISESASKIKESSKSMGSAIKTGFSDGANGFSQTVVTVLASGITEVQNRYNTWHSGGEASAQKLADGFDKLGGKLKSSISEEMGYALAELDNYKDDFYDKGAMLGQSLVDGFKSKKGFDQNSPAKITKSIREELGYSMEALNDGRMLMYNGGVALGQALYSGYNSYGNLRTNVGVLANKGVTNEQLQATARNVQSNNNNKGQVVKSFNPTVNIDMSNSTIIGVDDLDARIKASIDRAFVEYNSPNGAVGY